MRFFVLAAVFALPLPALANDEIHIQDVIQGIAAAADAQDWQRLNVKFSDHVILNQLSLETTEGARVAEQTIVDTWAALLPRFDQTTHIISNIEITGMSSVIARATASYHATYHLDAHIWEQTGQLDYVLKNSEEGWQVTALNTSPGWENRSLADLLSSSHY